MIFEKIIRPAIFKMSENDPEISHEKAMSLLKNCQNHAVVLKMMKKMFTVKSEQLHQKIMGLDFDNPIGLAAGFDKNSEATHALASLGFGFLETGTITRYEQTGNERPRIFRFPKHCALVNRMGFNNQGADKVSKSLKLTSKPTIPLGISIGKSKVTPLEEATSDYLYSFNKLYPFADYFAINVSSPNTLGLRELQGKEYLSRILGDLVRRGYELSNLYQVPVRPIVVKIAPDLTYVEIDQILHVCADYSISAIIATNTTINKDALTEAKNMDGGMSGAHLFDRSLEVVRYIRKRNKKIIIIGVGGISNHFEAYEMIKAGANLLQIYTSLIYQGPMIVKFINKGLLELMKKNSINHISEL